jgi:hypothetical protein
MLLFDLRVRRWHRREECLGIWVEGRGVELFAWRCLHHLAGIHYRDAVADVAHHGQVVRDEQVREIEFLLQVHQQVDDLRLDGRWSSGHEPVHGSSSGTCLSTDSEANLWYCSSCEQGGGPLALVASILGDSKRAARVGGVLLASTHRLVRVTLELVVKLLIQRDGCPFEGESRFRSFVR